jgi:hypothetical protein
MAMSDNTEDALERSEIELLLPWYVTGRLDAAEKAHVEAFLAAHPDMRRQLALVREEQEHAIRANEKLKQPSSGSLDRLIASIAHDQRAPQSLRTAWNRLAEFFAAPTSGGVRWAAGAVGMLLLIQAAVIGSLLLARSGDTYQTASGKQVQAGGSTLLVGFADGATAPAMAMLLSELDAQIVDGPKPGGMYRVRLTKAPASEAERQEVVRRLLARPDIVRIVLLGTD